MKRIDVNNLQINEMRETNKITFENMKKKVNQEISRAVFEVKGSYFEEENNLGKPVT